MEKIRIVDLTPNGRRQLYAAEENPSRRLERAFRSRCGFQFRVRLDLLKGSYPSWTYALSICREPDGDPQLLGFLVVNCTDLACDRVEVFFRRHRAEPVEKGWWGRGPQFKRA
jgi:hypothetical protein